MRALIFALVAVASAPSLGAEWQHCSDAGGAASFDFLPGDGTGYLTVPALTVTVGEKVWASDPANGPGDPVSIGQAFEDPDTIRIDALGQDKSVVARLRLFQASENGMSALGGVLTIPGQGAWAVSCSAG